MAELYVPNETVLERTHLQSIESILLQLRLSWAGCGKDGGHHTTKAVPIVELSAEKRDHDVSQEGLKGPA